MVKKIGLYFSKEFEKFVEGKDDSAEVRRLRAGSPGVRTAINFSGILFSAALSPLSIEDAEKRFGRGCKYFDSFHAEGKWLRECFARARRIAISIGLEGEEIALIVKFKEIDQRDPFSTFWFYVEISTGYIRMPMQG